MKLPRLEFIPDWSIIAGHGPRQIPSWGHSALRNSSMRHPARRDTSEPRRLSGFPFCSALHLLYFVELPQEFLSFVSPDWADVVHLVPIQLIQDLLPPPGITEHSPDLSPVVVPPSELDVSPLIISSVSLTPEKHHSSSPLQFVTSSSFCLCFRNELSSLFSNGPTPLRNFVQSRNESFPKIRLSSIFFSLISMGNWVKTHKTLGIPTQTTAQRLPKPQAIDGQFTRLLGNLFFSVPPLKLLGHLEAVLPLAIDHFPDRIGTGEAVRRT
jgi:hypothetical protein